MSARPYVRVCVCTHVCVYVWMYVGVFLTACAHIPDGGKESRGLPSPAKPDRGCGHEGTSQGAEGCGMGGWTGVGLWI